MAEAAPVAPAAAPAPGATPAPAPVPPAGPAAVAPTPSAAPAAAPGETPKPEGDPGSLLSEPKAADPAKPAEPVDPAKVSITEAAKYADFAMPEGFEVDADGIGSFKDVAAKHGLSQAAAQDMLNMHIDQLKAAQTAPYQLWHDTQRDWQKTTMADKEIGGQNFTDVKKTIVSAINKIGGANATAMMQAIQSTGFGNNPEGIRLLYRALKPFAEGRFSPTGLSPTTGRKTPAEAFYGSPPNGAAPA